MGLTVLLLTGAQAGAWAGGIRAPDVHVPWTTGPQIFPGPADYSLLALQGDW